MNRAIPAFIIIAGLAVLYPMQKQIDLASPVDPSTDEALYLTSGETIKKLSLGLDGLAADIYWIRTVQYFGRKLLDSGSPITAGSTKDIEMPLLGPMLQIIVEIDPQYIPAYRFGAMFLPERDMEGAIQLLERGIENNPDEWQLYQDIAYIYWQSGNQMAEPQQTAYYEKAADYYERGSKLPGARWWMADMAGLMRIKGERRNVARAVYQRYLESEDEHIRKQAVARLKQLDSLDQRDALDLVLAGIIEKEGKCPQDLRLLIRRLQRVDINTSPILAQLDDKNKAALKTISITEDGTPVDPDGFPYLLDHSTCKVKLSKGSTIAE